MTKDRGRIENSEVVQHSSRELQEERHANLVSVVIPCYNQAYFLGEAIESVLSQSYRQFEVVVVDDGSTDNTSEVASRYARAGVRLNPSVARNRGLGVAKGKYVVFLDSDDKLLPQALEVGVRELKARPACAFVVGHQRLIRADASSLGSPPPSNGR
jgi:glycosyltransferase involved in cell wall biosynthesis